jgi:hypothetical protein
MMRFLSQMMKLPITAFVYSMEMFSKTLHGLQRIADQSIDVVFGSTVQEPGDSLETRSDLTNGAEVSGITQTFGHAPGSQSNLKSNTTNSSPSGTTGEGAETTHKEARNMRDTDLSDHKMLKLVRYKILFIKRKLEVAFPEVEELIADDTTDTGYTAWKIAQFIQNLARRKTQVPSQWGDKYPSDKKDDKGEPLYRDGNILLGLPEDDKKFLRVYYEVLDRYPREKLHKEERQIEVLEQIRDGIGIVGNKVGGKD